ncbi:MAG: PIN domain nuclease [Sphingomonas adhaesiva]|uniref:type II toxin-antitoxin system VapC family toxin n=1 Tax=Sphingomonas adhaesiva TaxID=28212 RepID=UPI002FF767D9
MIILVVSSIWIDLFRGRSTVGTAALETLIKRRRVAIGDLILTEVLQGFKRETEFERARQTLLLAAPLTIVDEEVALQAARHYRTLRDRGITVRKTIDTLIATRCILDRTPLLYSDRDFDPFVQHLGLRSAMDLPGVT